MKVSIPRSIISGDRARVEVTAHYGGEDRVIWFDVPEAYDKYLVADRSDAFVVALLPVAMELNESVRIEGRLSQKLHLNLSRHLQHLYASVWRNLTPVEITADELVGTDIAGNGVVTGFSGGIDSFSVIADHYLIDQPPGFTLTHLFFSNVGSHGSGRDELFMKRYDRLLPAANELGLPFVPINSNLADIGGPWYPKVHPLRNTAAVLAVRKLWGRLVYGGGYDYSTCFFGRNREAIQRTDPAALPLLSTESFESMSGSPQRSRVDKTRLIGTLDLAQRYLDVCARPQHDTNRRNCSHCLKCLRTLLTMEAFGVHERFTDVFDLEVYGRHRDEYIRYILFSRKDFERELVALLHDRGVPTPWLTRTSARIYHANPWRIVPKPLRRKLLSLRKHG